MSHEVESMFSAREVPWHGLGTVTDDVLTAEEAIIAAELDWIVELRPTFFVGNAGQTVQVKDRYAVVRDRDEKALGVVGSAYTPFQNVEAFRFMDNLVDSGEAKFETAGSLKGGKQVFVTMKVPQGINYAGEQVDLYLFLRTSHDGTKAVSVHVTPVRVVCMNTTIMALAAAKQSWAAAHTTTLEGRVAEARDTLQLTFEYRDAFADEMKRLMGTKMVKADARSLFTKVFPDRPSRDEKVERVMHRLENSPTVEGHRDNAWGVFNALTEELDWGREFETPEAKLLNLTEGAGAQARRKALQLLAV